MLSKNQDQIKGSPVQPETDRQD